MKKTLHIGIWGFGRVGKAAALFFAQKGHHITVMDKRQLSAEERAPFAAFHLDIVDESDPATFLTTHDFILPSPGIDLAPWQAYASKFTSELDLFANAFHGNYIAITGTVGKTTIVTLLSSLLEAAGRAPLTGGNIGIPTFTLLAQRPNAQLALLEVSSFQLEHCTHFAPDLAIWTNFFSNHLDRHTHLDDYFQAKKQLLNHQKAYQKALLNAELVVAHPELLNIPGELNLFTTKDPASLSLPAHIGSLFFFVGRTACVTSKGMTTELFSLDDTTVVTFPENLLVVGAGLHLLGHNPAHLFRSTDKALKVPEHRLEPFSKLNTSTFYNDSKATTPQATLAAVTQLAPQPIRLFLGGLSKGIDREPMVKELATTTVCHVYCFGKEATHLAALCERYAIAHTAFADLSSATAACVGEMQPGEQVLFSPSGSSFDLFKDFEDRGRVFKQLINNLVTQH
jgi:UDP-N-acetylmuramoylalanine--D-glutamate ligase